jgi:uncharacterized protein YndB with AHSA1/START domain
VATTFITPNEDAVVSEIHITAPPERVFQALIDPAQVMRWWTSEACPIDSFEMEAKVGGRWRYNSSPRGKVLSDGSSFRCEGEVIEFDPPRTLAYSWAANWHNDRSRRTIVRWELAAKDGGTLVKITHSGLVQEPAARKDYGGGWPGVVSQLKKFVES